MGPTAKVPFYLGSRAEGKMSEQAGCSANVAIGRNNFPLVWAEDGPDFTSKRRQIDVSQLFKGLSEKFKKRWLLIFRLID
jgi:hypothetical protein